MEWVLGIAGAAFIYWLIVLRPGRLDFWRVAARNPDLAYEHFLSSPCWKVFGAELPLDYRKIVPKTEWAGPFTLWVPKLGDSRIYIFGKYPDMNRSQNEFLRGLRKNP